MKYFAIAAALASVGNSVLAFHNNDMGYALGLLGGFGAWVLLAINLP